MMKKCTLLLALLLAVVSLNAQNQKMKIAVMDFKNGVGVEEKDVKGLSDMLINTLYETGKFSIVERSQIDQVIKEQGFQLSGLTNEQLAEMGKILGVKSVLVGTVNNIASEYNVDVRVVDVESGEIVTTAGANKTPNITYRGMMEKIGKKLVDNLTIDEPKPVVVVVEKPKVEEPKPVKQHFRKSGFTLRPEVGLNIPINDDTEGCFVLSPSVELAFGYQFGAHLFFGIKGGYGGKLDRSYPDPYYSGQYYEEGTMEEGYPIILTNQVKYIPHSFPIKANIRWYLLDHMYSFIIDVQSGFYFFKDRSDKNPEDHTYSERSDSRFFSRASLGFAVKNFEATVGTHMDFQKRFGLCIDLSYRFGTNTTFKDLKWW